MEKIILFSIIFLMVGGVLSIEQFNTKALLHYYRDGYELNYYGQDYDAVSFDLIGYRNNYRNINNINVNFTPSFLNEGISITNLNSDGKVFASTKIIQVDNLDKVFVIITGKNSLNEDMYSEVLINMTSKQSIIKSLGYSINKNDYKLGFFIFMLLIVIILFMLYKIWRKK